MEGMSNRRLMELAVRGLETERERVEKEIAQLRAQLGQGKPAVKAAAKKPTKRKGRKMSAAAKKAVSERMKAWWAKRKRPAKKAAKKE